MIDYKWQGLVDYEESLRIQSLCHVANLNESKDIVLGLHHPDVITLGRRLKKKSLESFLSSTELLSTQINSTKIIETDRGGQATIHSPGQLVIYPIINLRRYQLGVSDFVRLLLQTTSLTLGDVAADVEFYISDDLTGVYVKELGKIAFCGLRIDRGVSRHGVSINIFNDLNLFRRIVSCGVANAKVCSLCEIIDSVDLSESYMKMFFNRWQGHFQKALDKKLLDLKVDCPLNENPSLELQYC